MLRKSPSIAGIQFTRMALMFITLFYFSARFIHLLADFPTGINWSGDLFTDEGWYSNGAVRFMISGHWIVNGDFNPIINVPVFQFAALFGFKLLGLSILSARIVELAFFSVLLGVTFLLIRLEWGDIPALLSLALICGDFLIFLYSRLAFLEIPMLTFVMLALFSYKKLQKANLQIIVTSVILFLATLTKTTAIFAITTFLFLLWTENIGLNEKVKRSVSFILFYLMLYLIYLLFIYHNFRQDFEYFNTINFSKRITPQIQSIIENSFSIFRDLFNLHISILWLSILAILFIVLVNRVILRNRWLVAIMLLIISYIGLLSITSYHPPRYYIPLLFVLCTFCGISFGDFLAQKTRNHFIRLLSILTICAFIIVNSLSIFSYLSSPNYSFITMVRQVSKTILSSGQPSPLLIGPFANTISLESGIFSINSNLGLWDIRKKMETYQPTYFISFANDNLINELSNRYVFSPVAEFRVLENYYNGNNIILYKITEVR
ncbi:MAG: ArnT family glycosyltransferase [Thermanaerothrix sp.]|uniref:ArnT family glycosyltransferase n=1 Tax=Thermanaerothrix sp. TaxID=2972675 RepID=UPI003C7DFFF2